MKSSRTLYALLVLATLAAMVLALAGASRLSATWDEPLHLLSGWAALRYGDYRFGPGMPPLVKMWAALPLLVTPGVRTDRESPTWQAGMQVPESRRFLFRENDADRLLLRARAMIVLLWAALGWLLFFWARDLFGRGTAAVLLVLYFLEPNLMAHGSLVTTDLGLTLLYFAAAYALWRMLRLVTPWNLAAFALAFGLAQVTKFSAFLLLPVAGAILLVRATCPQPWGVRLGRGGAAATRGGRLLLAGGILLATLLATWVSIWGVYRFRHAIVPPGSPARVEFMEQEQIATADPRLKSLLFAADRHHLLPNPFAMGLLYIQGGTQATRYFLGEYPEGKVWYFYPVVFLLKTPLSVTILLAAGLAWLLLARPWPASWRLALLLPPGAYLLAGMLQPFTTGVRHILPLYPFVLLLAGGAVSALLVGRRRLLLAGLGLLLLTEFAVIYPDGIASFTLAVGGPARGDRYLLDSNLDWGQDLKRLGEWAARHRVELVNLNYFGTAMPEYYRIPYVPLWGMIFQPPREPVLPGWVAVSLTQLRGLYGDRKYRAYYHPLLEREPDLTIGRSLRLYWCQEPWWK